jgi:hypothetical protein
MLKHIDFTQDEIDYINLRRKEFGKQTFSSYIRNLVMFDKMENESIERQKKGKEILKIKGLKAALEFITDGQMNGDLLQDKHIKNMKKNKWLLVDVFGDGYITDDFNEIVETALDGRYCKIIYETVKGVRFIIANGDVTPGKLHIVIVPIDSIPLNPPKEIKLVKLKGKQRVIDVNLF